MEHFANLPFTADIFPSIILLRNKTPAWQFIWVGLIGTACILTKAWIKHNEVNTLKTDFLCLLGILSGVLILLAIAGVYFASLGVWEQAGRSLVPTRALGLMVVLVGIWLTAK